MEVLLLKDVKNVGKKDQVIKVSDGYATNFLFKQKLAVPASTTSIGILKDKQDEIKRNEENKKAEAISLKELLKDKVIEFKLKVGENSRLFGSITNKQIADKLEELGYKIDKRVVEKVNIKSLGNAVVKIDLYKDVVLKLNIVVKGE
jgi:large subunit ribosomal protein L9